MDSSTLTQRLLSPFAVLMYVYVGYISILYANFHQYVYWDLMNLGTRIIGALPGSRTVALYVFGAAVLGIGFLAGSLLADRATGSRGRLNRRVVAGVAAIRSRLAGVWGSRSMSPGFALGVAGWVVSLCANLAQIAVSGVSLADIATRWGQSPMLVFFAGLQMFFVPLLVVTARTRTQRLVAGLAFVVGVLALGLLGARNLPAKLVIATFLATVLIARPRHIARVAIVFLVVLVLAMGIVGAFSKSEIYGAAASTGLLVALTYSDSVGTIYTLDQLVRFTPPTGLYHGVLLKDSFLSLIPGVEAEYASYQIGRYLSGRSSFKIGDTVVERSVSLAPTLLGAPYADHGVPGVAGQMLLLGGLFGYMQRRSKHARWLIPFLVLMASYVINGVNAGIYGPVALMAVGAAALAVCADWLVAPALAESETTIEGVTP